MTSYPNTVDLNTVTVFSKHFCMSLGLGMSNLLRKSVFAWFLGHFYMLNWLGWLGLTSDKYLRFWLFFESKFKVWNIGIYPTEVEICRPNFGLSFFWLILATFSISLVSSPKKSGSWCDIAAFNLIKQYSIQLHKTLNKFFWLATVMWVLLFEDVKWQGYYYHMWPTHFYSFHREEYNYPEIFS